MRRIGAALRETLRENYDGKTLRADVMAGLVVAQRTAAQFPVDRRAPTAPRPGG